MSKVQLTINVTVETKHRIEAAAAEEHLSTNDYVLTVVERQLANRGLVPVRPPLTQEEFEQLMKDMRELRESILAERNGEFIDIEAIIDSVRAENDVLYELR